MEKGFMYLTAIINVYSRFVVGWGISNNLETAVRLLLPKEEISRYGNPEIANSG